MVGSLVAAATNSEPEDVRVAVEAWKGAQMCETVGVLPHL